MPSERVSTPSGSCRTWCRSGSIHWGFSRGADAPTSSRCTTLPLARSRMHARRSRSPTRRINGSGNPIGPSTTSPRRSRTPWSTSTSELIEIFGLPSPDDPQDNDLDPTTNDFAESQSHPDLTNFLLTNEALALAGFRPRQAPGQVQLALSEIGVAALRVEQAEGEIDIHAADIRSQAERIALVLNVQADRLEVNATACGEQLRVIDRAERLEPPPELRGGRQLDHGRPGHGRRSRPADRRHRQCRQALLELPRRQRVRPRAGTGQDPVSEGGKPPASGGRARASTPSAGSSSVSGSARRSSSSTAPSSSSSSSRPSDGSSRRSAADSASSRASAVSPPAVEGQLLEERWRDLSFRVYRNAALKNYRALFDIAARYAVLTTRAYAYEFDARSDGEDVLAGIYRERRIGSETGIGGGIQGVLNRLAGAVTVNNFNRPLETLGERSFSFRRNLLGIGVEDFPADDLEFRAFLETSIVERIEDLAEIGELAQVSVDRDYGPGVVIPFATEINSRNFFGRGPELPFGNSNFSLTRNAKIRNFAIRLDGVDASLGTDPESGTVFVYLLPAGDSVLRENTNKPRIEDELITPWAVVDQFLPVPPLASVTEFSRRSYNPWRSTAQSNGNFLNEIKRQRDSEAQIELGQPRDEIRLNSNLAGRSAWNTQWLLVIPGSQWTSSSDPLVIRTKLLQFIYGNEADPSQHRGITDIRLIIAGVLALISRDPPSPASGTGGGPDVTCSRRRRNGSDCGGARHQAAAEASPRGSGSARRKALPQAGLTHEKLRSRMLAGSRREEGTPGRDGVSNDPPRPSDARRITVRLYRGMTTRYRPERVGRTREGLPTGTDFTDCPFLALRFGWGPRGVVLVLDVPEDDFDLEPMPRLRVTEELYSLNGSGPKRFMVWGRFDDFLVAEIPARDLRAQVRRKGIVAQPDEVKSGILADRIDRWINERRRGSKVPERPV